MKELKLLAQVVSGQISECMTTLNHLNVKENEKEYNHKLGEATAYNDVLNLIMWRINELERGGKK